MKTLSHALIALAVALAGIVGLGSTAPAFADSSSDITSVMLSRSVSIVYPHVDGYRDSIAFDIAPTSEDGIAADSTGVLKIRRGTTVVRSFALQGGAGAEIVWHGLINSRIVTGSYSASVTYTNADATTATASVSFVVSSRRLVPHSWAKSVESGAVTHCGPPSIICDYTTVVAPAPPGHLGKGYLGAKYYGQHTANFVTSELRLPSTIVAAPKVVMSVNATFTIAGAKGRTFELQPCRFGAGSNSCGEPGGTAARSSSGTLQTGHVTLESNSPFAAWNAAVVPSGASATVGHYAVHIVYYTLG